MKKIIAVVLICMFLTSCGNSLFFNNRVYKPYGLANEGSRRDYNIEYDIIWGNVFWSVIFAETVIVPLYFIGFEIMEPVAVKQGAIIQKGEN